MAVLSFLSMFALMYAMVDSFSNVFGNVNQGYMAALMTAPMLIIELVLMGAMYPDKRLNLGIIAASVALLVASWTAIRTQAGVGDSQFLHSMIPHHAGALLMCNEASITDDRIQKLCDGIRESQAREIAEMKRLLSEVK